MPGYSRAHLSDPTLARELAACAARERGVTAELLACLAEYDARRLYLPAGHPSMYSFCVHELRFCEEAAFKRIRAARTARRFPMVLEMLADGRLHLTAVVMLASVLTEDNARELLAAAVHRTKAGIEKLLAERFPRPDLPERIDVLAAPPGAASLGIDSQLSPGTVGMTKPEQPAISEASTDTMPSPLAALGSAPERVTPVEPRPRVTPLAPERFAIQCTVSRATHDNLRRAQDLLRHQVPDGSLEAVLDRALALLVRDLEKRKHAATDRPGSAQRRPAATRPGANPRYIPAAVKRAVWARDGGRCTFVGENGRRCDARGALEYDHGLPLARGGTSTTGNLRLRCRAHNQLGAEREFGAELMRHKRAAARDRRRGKQRPAAVSAHPSP